MTWARAVFLLGRPTVIISLALSHEAPHYGLKTLVLGVNQKIRSKSMIPSAGSLPAKKFTVCEA